MKRSILFSTPALLAAMTLPSYGQLFSDTDGDVANFDTGVTTGLTDVRFGFDYGNFDIFGDGFTTGSIPEAPNSSGGTATTGIFISVNNDSIAQGGAGAAAAAGVFAKNLNVGEGTSNPNFKMTVDVFNSTATGWDYGDPRGIEVNGTTNYAVLGALFEDPANFSVQGLVTGTGEAGGIALATTGEGGSGSDWYTVVDGKTYESRITAPDTTGTAYLGIRSGLATDHINQAFIADGFTDTTGVTPLQHSNTDNASYVSPIPGSEALFDDADVATYKDYYGENFPVHNDPLHYSSTNSPGTPLANDTIQDGVIHNQWATHEVSVVDGVYYHSINGVPIIQLAIDDDPLSPDQTIFDDIDAAGTIMLGFWDRFSSISDDPEGANFIVYDNVVVESLNSGDAPFDMAAYLVANGFAPGAVSIINGDYNDSGQVEQGDLDLVLQNWGVDTDVAGVPTGWVNDLPSGQIEQTELDGVLQNWGNTAAPDFSGSNVPEPTTLAVLGGLGLIALRRRSA